MFDNETKVQVANPRNGEWSVLINDVATAVKTRWHNRRPLSTAELDQSYGRWICDLLMKLDCNPRMGICNAVDLAVVCSLAVPHISDSGLVLRLTRFTDFVSREAQRAVDAMQLAA